MYKRSSLLKLCKNCYFVYFCITWKKIGSVEVWYSEYFEIIVVYSFFSYSKIFLWKFENPSTSLIVSKVRIIDRHG